MVNNCLKVMAGDGMDQFGSRTGAHLRSKRRPATQVTGGAAIIGQLGKKGVGAELASCERAVENCSSSLMRRPEFIAGLSSAAAWPLAGRAQQSAMPIIDYMLRPEQRGVIAKFRGPPRDPELGSANLLAILRWIREPPRDPELVKAKPNLRHRRNLMYGTVPHMCGQAAVPPVRRGSQGALARACLAQSSESPHHPEREEGRC